MDKSHRHPFETDGLKADPSQRLRKRAGGEGLVNARKAIPSHRSARSHGPTGGAVKRLADFVVAGALLTFLAPLLLLIALLVRLETPGPAIFRQMRGGYGGRPFQIYKFRTMTVMQDGPAVPQASRNDARVTTFGAFLRQSSLDELPQLINVLQGHMSLIGPRPHALAHDAQFAAIDANYAQRFRARPGVTGLAQVSGNRGPTPTYESVRERLSYDVHYIRTWSLAMDMKILVRTLVLLFRGSQAF